MLSLISKTANFYNYGVTVRKNNPFPLYGDTWKHVETYSGDTHLVSVGLNM